MEGLSLQDMPIRRPCRLLPLLLVVLALTLAGRVEAQRDRSSVGAQLGYARTWIRTNDDAINEVFEGRQGAFVSLFFRHQALPWLSLQPELDFTIKGGEFDVLEPSGARRSLELGYLEIPLLVRLAPKYRRNHVRPVIFAGASAGFRVGCSIRTTFANDSIAVATCDEISDELQKVETSWLAGGGVQWETEGVSIALEARFSQAFTTLFKDDPTEPRNQLLAVLLVLTL
jgi:hypothetical protein